MEFNTGHSTTHTHCSEPGCIYHASEGFEVCIKHGATPTATEPVETEKAVNPFGRDAFRERAR
jgi:hypothetical protein